MLPSSLTRFILALAFVALNLVFVACGDDSSEDSDTTGATGGSLADMSSSGGTTGGATTGGTTTMGGMTADMEDDVETIGPGTCEGEDDPNLNLTVAEVWNFICDPSEGSFQATEDGGVTTFVVDGTGGGSTMAATMNAFIYVDLDGSAKVEVNDFVAATTNTTWDIAFKRSTIRINSADSGPGNVEVGVINQTTFDAVTSVPMDLAFEQDVILDEAGEVINIGALPSPAAAFHRINANSDLQLWYDYDGATMSILPIPEQVYILRNTDGGATFKLQITDIQDNGIFTLRVAPL